MKSRHAVPIVIDTDPGIDDVVTIALAARSPEIDIVAVTTTYGNAALDATTRNTRDILRLTGRSDIRVIPGADRPLRRECAPAVETHGETGAGFAECSALLPVTPGIALVEALSQVDHPVTLVTLGPLTNLAMALDRDENLVRERVARHVGMFGTINAIGNTNRWADFNSWCDPEAVDRVLRAGLSTEMVGLDVTRRMVLAADEVDRLASSADPLAAWLGQALRFYVQFHREREQLEGCVVNDVLTVGELLSPGLLQFQVATLSVVLDDEDHRGHTREAADGAPVSVAMEVDVGRMKSLLRRVFGNAI